MFSRGAVVAFVGLLAELLVFRMAIGVVGAWGVVLVSLGAAIVGLFIVRRQVPRLAESGQAAFADLAQGRHCFGLEDSQGDTGTEPGPVDRSVDALLVTIAGLLMIVPGLLTGALGLLLLLPPLRALVRARARDRLAPLVPTGTFAPFNLFGAATRRSGPFGTDIVDVDVVSEDTQRPAPPELS